MRNISEIADVVDKMQSYQKLVIKRKTCAKCQGLTNPSNKDKNLNQYDSAQIGPWTLWQRNLDSDIVIVGQDWGDISYFVKWKGRDQPSGNPTNENLQELLKSIGVKIDKPQDHQNQVIFLTNLILCLKTGGLQAQVYDQWFKNCSNSFFKPLINIINPKVIIALGMKVSKSILNIYNIQYDNVPYYELLIQSPYQLTNSLVLFPVYHCGKGGVNRNRSMSEQKEDWLKISEWLKHQK